MENVTLKLKALHRRKSGLEDLQKKPVTAYVHESKIYGYMHCVSM
jgi:hypothetical protein